MKSLLLVLMTLASTVAFSNPLKDNDKILMMYSPVGIYEFIGVKSKVVYSPANANGVAMYQGTVEITLKIEGFLCEDIKTLGTSYYTVGNKKHLEVVAGRPFTEELTGCAAASRPTTVIVPVYIYEPEFPGRAVETSLGVISVRNNRTGETAQTEVIFKAKHGKSTLTTDQLE